MKVCFFSLFFVSLIHSFLSSDTFLEESLVVRMVPFCCVTLSLSQMNIRRRLSFFENDVSRI